MYKLEFMDIKNPTNKFEVKCGELSIVLDTTIFGDRTDYTVTKFIDHTMYEESDLISEEEIDFEVMDIGDIDYNAFKRFIRARNASFIVRVTKGEQSPRMAICKHYNETLRDLGSTDFTNWRFSLVRTSRWIEISSMGFDLNTQNQGVGSYADSETFMDGYTFADSDTFTDGMIYGGSAQTIESFVVDLPENDGDKYAYLRVTINDANDGFGFGLDEAWTDTIEAFKAKDSFVIGPDQLVIVDSFPLFKQVSLKDSEGIVYNIQNQREVSKRTYIRVPLGSHTLEFEGVRSGTILMYKQYRLPY